MILAPPARMLIFDIDETLLKSEEVRMAVRNDYLKKELNVAPIDYLEYRQNCVGRSLKNCIAPWLKKTRPGIKISIYELAEEMKKRERAMYKKGNISAYPYVEEFLDALSQVPEIILGVCSGEDQRDIEKKLSCAELSQYFNVHNRISRSEAGGQYKPSPAMYLVNWAQYAGQILRQEVRIFEDNEEGILAGYYGEFPTIAVPSKWSIGQDFSKANAIAQKGFEDILRLPEEYLGCHL